MAAAKLKLEGAPAAKLEKTPEDVCIAVRSETFASRKNGENNYNQNWTDVFC